MGSPSNGPPFTALSVVNTWQIGHVETLDEASHLPVTPPDRITRQLGARNGGTIGENALDGANPDAGRSYIPHQFIPRVPKNVTPYDKNIDVTIQVPGVFVGMPL